jgi:TatD DNase family protein
MIIDTHVHYNIEPLFSNDEWLKVPDEETNTHDSTIIEKYGVLKTKDDGWYYPRQVWKDHWKKAQDNGIKKSIVVGTDYNSNYIAAMVAKSDEHLFASAGEHPTYITEQIEGWLLENKTASEIEGWLTNMEEFEYFVDNSKLVAIGEVGLDYFHMPKDVSTHAVIKELQKKSFSQYILLAHQKNLPLIIHIRDRETPEEPTDGNAYWDALKILKEHDVGNFTLHCVSGPLSYVKAAIEMGGYMGFDGNISYPNAHHIRNIFQLVPEDRRLVETDAPYLPPQGYRGKICEPWMLSKTVEYIEAEFKVDKSSFAQNAKRLFKLDEYKS